MRFTIGQISKLTGISASGIRYYEEAGVISPVRGKNGKYRDFSMHELQLLLTCKQYRDCGFSLPESVELLNKSGVQDVRDQLATLAAKLKQTITHNQLLYELIDQKSNELDCLFHEEPCCELIEHPALYRFKLWQPGAPEEICLPDDQVVYWMKLAPFTNSCLLLSADNFLNCTGDLETDWGMAIDEHYATGLNLQTAPYGVYLPAGECVKTVVPVTDDLCIPSAKLQPARNFILKLGLEVCSPVISRLFYLTNTKNRFQRYDELWIPVEQAIKGIG